MKTKTITLFLALLASASTLLAQTPTSITVAEANERIKTMEEDACTVDYYEIIGYAVGFCDTLKNNQQTFVIADKDIIHFSVEEDVFAILSQGIPDMEVLQGNKVRVVAKIQNSGFGIVQLVQGEISVLDATEVVNEKCGQNVTWRVSNDTLLTISGTGAMYDYSDYVLVPWYNNYQKIKSIDISDGVTTIGRLAFFDLPNLTSIHIPHSVTRIGDGAFCDCKGLTSIAIPNGVTDIGDYAFDGCSGLTSITIPNGVTDIGDYAFYDCRGLKSIAIPNGVTNIGDYAFYDCRGLTSITFPNSVTSIGYAAFNGCQNLAIVDVLCTTPPTINSSFSNCSNQLEIHVPCGTLDTYKNEWSQYSSRLTYAPFPYRINTKAENGFVSVPSLKNFTQCDESIEITAIPSRGYYFVRWADGVVDNPRIISVTKDTTVEAIFDYLLEGKCGKDSALTWKLDTTTMALEITGKGSLSENYTYGAFIKSLTIGHEVTTIGQSAFLASSLTSVTIPNSVTSIGYAAFNGCQNLAIVDVLCTTPPTINSSFSNCSNQLEIHVPCGTLDTYKNEWSQYSSRLTYAPFPYRINTKAENGFVSVPSLKNFTQCDESIEITAIPSRGYYFVRWADGVVDNPRIISVTKDTTVEAIFDYLLEGKCGKDSMLIWKFDPTTMALNIAGAGALSENYTYGSFIESLTIGNEITSIGQSAFYGCNNLTNVILGSSVKVLEESAFYNCSSIENITCYSQRPPTVKSEALYGLDYSTIVYVPADYLNTYKMHDTWGLYDVRPLSNPTDPEVETGEYIIHYTDKNNEEIYQENVILHIPVAPQVEGFTFLYWQPVETNIANGLIIQAVYEAENTSATPDVVSNPSNNAKKLIRQGNVYILTDDHTYTITGQKVK